MSAPDPRPEDPPSTLSAGPGTPSPELSPAPEPDDTAGRAPRQQLVPEAIEDGRGSRGGLTGRDRNDAPTPTPEALPAPETVAEVAAEVASDVRAAIAPVGSAMKADVGNLADFLRGIQSGYLLAGLGLLAATALVGVLVTLLGGFSDWFMHLAMYVVLLSFVLLYVRAHQRNYRIMRAIWAVLALGLIAFFAWILVDLVPARLDVLSGRPRPGGLTGPEVVLRPHADALWAPVVMLSLVGLWLLSHWLVLARFRKPHGPTLS